VHHRGCAQPFPTPPCPPCWLVSCTLQLFPRAGYSGYPLVFDINLNADGADRRLQYLVDGSYIDNATRSITVSLVTYNGTPLCPDLNPRAHL